MKYCSECGYKIEGNFKFCPNCGSQLKNSTDSDELKTEVSICKNCGEENPKDRTTCFSCGVPLKAGQKNKSYSKINSKKSAKKKNNSEEQNGITEDKVLDTKKILMISSLIVIVFVVALFISGVFDSEIQNNITQVNSQTQSSGDQVSLANLEEINELENKIAVNPDDMESTLHLAHLSQDSRLYEKAIANYKKYLEKNPSNADARVDMGICYYNLGDNTKAINEMETALKYEPKHQIAHLNLGIVNLTAQNIEDSKEWFRKAVEIDPDSEAGKRAQELLKSH